MTKKKSDSIPLARKRRAVGESMPDPVQMNDEQLQISPKIPPEPFNVQNMNSENAAMNDPIPIFIQPENSRRTKNIVSLEDLEPDRSSYTFTLKSIAMDDEKFHDFYQRNVQCMNKTVDFIYWILSNDYEFFDRNTFDQKFIESAFYMMMDTRDSALEKFGPYTRREQPSRVLKKENEIVDDISSRKEWCRRLYTKVAEFISCFPELDLKERLLPPRTEEAKYAAAVIFGNFKSIISNHFKDRLKLVTRILADYHEVDSNEEFINDTIYCIMYNQIKENCMELVNHVKESLGLNSILLEKDYEKDMYSQKTKLVFKNLDLQTVMDKNPGKLLPVHYKIREGFIRTNVVILNCRKKYSFKKDFWGNIRKIVIKAKYKIDEIPNDTEVDNLLSKIKRKGFNYNNNHNKNYRKIVGFLKKNLGFNFRTKLVTKLDELDESEKSKWINIFYKSCWYLEKEKNESISVNYLYEGIPENDRLSWLSPIAETQPFAIVPMFKKYSPLSILCDKAILSYIYNFNSKNVDLLKFFVGKLKNSDPNSSVADNLAELVVLLSQGKDFSYCQKAKSEISDDALQSLLIEKEAKFIVKRLCIGYNQEEIKNEMNLLENINLKDLVKEKMAKIHPNEIHPNASKIEYVFSGSFFRDNITAKFNFIVNRESTRVVELADVCATFRSLHNIPCQANLPVKQVITGLKVVQCKVGLPKEHILKYMDSSTKIIALDTGVGSIVRGHSGDVVSEQFDLKNRIDITKKYHDHMKWTDELQKRRNHMVEHNLPYINDVQVESSLKSSIVGTVESGLRSLMKHRERNTELYVASGLQEVDITQTKRKRLYLQDVSERFLDRFGSNCVILSGNTQVSTKQHGSIASAKEIYGALMKVGFAICVVNEDNTSQLCPLCGYLMIRSQVVPGTTKVLWKQLTCFSESCRRNRPTLRYLTANRDSIASENIFKNFCYYVRNGTYIPEYYSGQWVKTAIPRDMTEEQCAIIERQTLKQARVGLFAQIRKGRITASTLGNIWSCKDDLNGYSNVFKMAWADREFLNLQEFKARAKLSLNNVEWELSGSIICPWNQHLLCSPDGVKKVNGKIVEALEIKSSLTTMTIEEAITVGKLVYLKNIGTKRNPVYQLKSTHRYYFQVQLTMYILKLNKMTFCVYLAEEENEYCQFEVLYDEVFITSIVDQIVPLWVEHNLDEDVAEEVYLPAHVANRFI